MSRIIPLRDLPQGDSTQAKPHEELKQFLKEIPKALADKQGCSRQLTQSEVDEAQILDSYLRKDRVISIRVTQKALKQGEFVEDMLKRIRNKKGGNNGKEIF